MKLYPQINLIIIAQYTIIFSIYYDISFIDLNQNYYAQVNPRNPLRKLKR